MIDEVAAVAESNDNHVDPSYTDVPYDIEDDDILHHNFIDHDHMAAAAARDDSDDQN